MNAIRSRPRAIARPAIRGRRLQGALGAAAVVGLVALVSGWLEQRLVAASWFNGYVLLGMVVVLALFRIRKLFPGAAWAGLASGWMQFHAWTGIAALAVFGLHVGWRWPDGAFEQTLALAFVLTGASGVYGLAITRILPGRLASLPLQPVYEQIPVMRQSLAERAARIVGDCPGTTLARYHVNHVAAFLCRPRPPLFWLMPSARDCKRLVAAIRGLDRYLSAPERAASRQLMQIVREKDDLDYHRAVQGRLKWWLVVHVVLTMLLLVLVALHVVLVHVFAGAWT